MRRVLIWLFIFVSITVSAVASGNKRIDLDKHITTVPHKGQRSLDILEVSAFFNSNNESILIINEGESADISISIIDTLGANCVCSEKFAAIKDIELNLSGLLSENNLYRLEITIGDTVYCGYFNY